jgi:hypothetical protein
MSIVARFGGYCRLCEKPYEPGERIGRWLGREAHFDCRQAEIARRAAEGETEQLPEARGWADAPKMTRPKKDGRRLAHLGRIRIQDGRSQDGRFQSKPEQ